MVKSPAVDRLILKRLILTFPEAALSKTKYPSFNNDSIDAMPDQNRESIAEKIKEFENGKNK